MPAAAIERITIAGPVGSLEAIVDDSGGDSSRCALICHPHPLYGGTMENKVVTTLCRAFRDTGMPTLRFNFRGVGKSAGVFDDGQGETEDADAAALWCAARWPGRGLVIAGFSFGAYIALRLAQRRPASQLVTVAPPVARFDFSCMVPPAFPWLVIQGDADEVVDPPGVIHWAKSLDPPPQLVVMPGVGHFFHGSLQPLRDVVSGWIRSD